MVFDNGKPGNVRKLNQEELDKLSKEKSSEDIACQTRNFKFFGYHHKELLEKYPDEWVAIYNEEMVGTDKDFFVLLCRLHKKGIPTNKTVIQFMDTDPKPLILVQQGVAV